MLRRLHAPRRGLVALAALALTAGAMSACGSDSGSGSKSTTPPAATGDGAVDTTAASTSGGDSGETGAVADACALLSDDDVKAAFAAGGSALAITTVTRSPQNSPGTAACDFAWTADNGSSSNFGLFVYGPDVFAGIAADANAQPWDALAGAFETFDGPFIGNGTASVSITGLGADEVAATLMQTALSHVG